MPETQQVYIWGVLKIIYQLKNIFLKKQPFSYLESQTGDSVDEGECVAWGNWVKILWSDGVYTAWFSEGYDVKDPDNTSRMF